MKIRPLNDRILVKRLEGEEKTAGGIIIPDSAKEKPAEGEVVAVGPGKLNEAGARVAMDVAVGDRVLFSKYGGNLGADGSVAFLFSRVGSIVYPLDKGSADDMLEKAIEAGADEVLTAAEGHEFLCPVDAFGEVRDAPG